MAKCYLGEVGKLLYSELLHGEMLYGEILLSQHKTRFNQKN